MLKRLKNLMRISTKFDAGLVIYAIAVGALERGHHYFEQYPGGVGYMMLGASTLVVFIAGGALIDYVDMRQKNLSA